MSFLEIGAGKGRLCSYSRSVLRLSSLLLLELWIAVKLAQFVQYKDDFRNSTLGHALRADLLLVLDELLERLLAPIDQDWCGNARNLQLDLVDATLSLELLLVSGGKGSLVCLSHESLTSWLLPSAQFEHVAEAVAAKADACPCGSRE